MISAEELLADLVRLNTVNPPGNETICANYIANLMEAHGIEHRYLWRDENRKSLYARLKGTGEKPPLLLYGHMDTVGVENQNWTVPTHGAVVKDGCIWGRGTLDMKGFLVMYIMAMLTIKQEGILLPFDIILLCLADEEGDGLYGAKYICENHADLLEGVRYAFGEVGGIPLYLAGQKFSAIMVAEKQCSQVHITVKGTPGHGSVINKNNPLTKMGQALVKLSQCRLPLHVTPEVSQMIHTISDCLGPQGELLRGLLDPEKSDYILDQMGEEGLYFDALLHNTAAPTIVDCSNKSINVIPSKISFQVDFRLVPGQTIENGMAELQALLGEEFELELVNYDPGAAQTDMGLFPVLSQTIQELDPTAIPIPYVMSGVTDGRFFSTIGISTYGFTPMNYGPDFPFMPLIHGADERMPIASLHFGIAAVTRALQQI